VSGFVPNRVPMSAVALAVLLGAMAHPAWAGRIAPEVEGALRSAPPGARHRVIVKLPGAPALDESALKGRSKAFRNRAVVGALRSLERNQKPALETLKGHRAVGNVDRMRSLWIANAIAVEASEDAIRDLAAMYPGVEIVEDRPIRPLCGATGNPSGTPWNLDKIGAPLVWNQGFRGQGTVIAIIDTGVDGKHPALVPRYRGGTNSWHDVFGLEPVPVDYDLACGEGHGTLAAGIILATTPSGTPIGVAPDAKWIGVRIFDSQGKGNESDALAGLQWVLDPDGNPSTDDAPDVVNGSWYLDNAQAVSTCDTSLQNAVASLRAAGIVPVFASGNNTAPVIPAAYPESVAVGATNTNDSIWTDSGRGATACRPSPLVYPTLVAPGVDILTTAQTYGGAVPDSYFVVTGTSFAAPHVAGAAALLLSAYPHLGVESTEAALAGGAFDLGPTEPDSTFGAGRLDVLGSLNYVRNNIPDPPTGAGVKLLPGAVGLGLAWLPSPTTMVSSYTVSRNGAVVAPPVTGQPYSYDDSPVPVAGSYTYAVSAVKRGIASVATDAMLGNISRGAAVTADRVDGFDLVVLQEAMGSAFGALNWNPAADFNNDLMVNQTDLDILKTHFGQVMK